MQECQHTCARIQAIQRAGPDLYQQGGQGNEGKDCLNGRRQACKDDSALAKGLNVVNGKVTYKAVADVFGLPYEPIVL